jgi:hypothetical protein
MWFPNGGVLTMPPLLSIDPVSVDNMPGFARTDSSNDVGRGMTFRDGADVNGRERGVRFHQYPFSQPARWPG